MYKNHKVVVTMTSWTKRIGNCVPVIRALLNNTVKPDVVFLNLSEAEFPNKEANLPLDLVQLSRVEPAFRINWVSGPNTRTMKKVFPILPLIGDDDIVIYIDDDFLLPRGFVQSRVDDFINHGCKHAISSLREKLKSWMLTCLTGFQVDSMSSSSSLVTKKMLSGYEVFYNNPDVCYRSADDSLYTLLVTLNGFTYVPCSDYGLAQSGSCVHPIRGNYNTVSPLRTMGVFKKTGYSAQNTYITNLLYLTIVKNSNVGTWNKEIKDKLSTFRRLQKHEDSEFFSQVNGFKTVDIPVKQGTLTYWYWNSVLNAGDGYNQYFLSKVYSCPLEFLDGKTHQVDLCVCGSILLNEHVSGCRKVIGCGIQTKNNYSNLPKTSGYLAVRGRITREYVLNHIKNANKDMVLCDPGLLLSKLYTPVKPMAKTHKVGIIPHYVDESKVRKLYGEKYHIISMRTNDIEKLVDDILSCEVILSSSLHGIIFSHSYGVPAYHVQFTDFFNNGNFKFADYYSSFLGQVKYKKFVCSDFKMNVDEILQFHLENHIEYNPTMDMILEKQRQFIQVLPYKQYLSELFKKELKLETPSQVDLMESEQKKLHKCGKSTWKYAEFMYG